MSIEKLMKLGISKPGSQIYMSLLRKGDASATEIAKRTGLGRTYIYYYSQELLKIGLVGKMEKNSKIYYYAENPRILSELVNQKVREAREMAATMSESMNLLEDLYNSNVNKPLIKYFSGKTGIKEVFDMVYLDFDGSEIFVFTPNLDRYSSPEPKYRNSFLRKQIFTNLASNEGEMLKEYLKRDKRELRRTILINSAQVPISYEIILFGGEIIFGNLSKDHFFATWIKDTILVQFIRHLSMRAFESD